MTSQKQSRVVKSRRAGSQDTVTFGNPFDSGLPTVVFPSGPGADLASWARENRALVRRLLTERGAVLFRGFGIDDAVRFGAVVEGLSDDILSYSERSSPRAQVAGGIYTSTEHPADQHIVLHNEQSYTLDWPMRLVFCCSEEATTGGRTPLANSRRILGRLSAATVEAFETKGVQYLRNYLPGLSLSWQEAFGTASPDEVAAFCAAREISYEWVGPEHLRTRQVRPAVRRHPATGERTWFNHALFFHVTSLPSEVGEALVDALGTESLPYHTLYGDGTAIEPERVAEVRAAFEAETLGFDWQRGDVLVVENMLTAHGREPFTGPRRVLAAMIDPFSSLQGARA